MVRVCVRAWVWASKRQTDRQTDPVSLVRVAYRSKGEGLFTACWVLGWITHGSFAFVHGRTIFLFFLRLLMSRRNWNRLRSSGPLSQALFAMMRGWQRGMAMRTTAGMARAKAGQPPLRKGAASAFLASWLAFQDAAPSRVLQMTQKVSRCPQAWASAFQCSKRPPDI